MQILYTDGSDITEANQIAVEADAVLFAVGYNHDDEGEYVAADAADNYLGAKDGDRKDGLGLHKS